MTTQNTAHDDAGIVEVDGAQLRYRIEGHGPPCLVAGISVRNLRVFSLFDHTLLAWVRGLDSPGG